MHMNLEPSSTLHYLKALKHDIFKALLHESFLIKCLVGIYIVSLNKFTENVWWG